MIKIKNAIYNTVKGVFFDYGGVLEDLSFSDSTFLKGAAILRDILFKKGVALTASQLTAALTSGQEKYNNWYKKNNYRELPNEKMWSSFFLEEICKDKTKKAIVEEMSEELSSIYEFYLFTRRPARDMWMVLKTLFYSGYTLALISNTMSRTLIPERLKKFMIDEYFSAVVLSADIGIRKPRKEIFDAALKRTGLKAEDCIYVGDTLSRDIEGSRNAGFRTCVLIESDLTADKDRDYTGTVKPDNKFNSFSELFQILK